MKKHFAHSQSYLIVQKVVKSMAMISLLVGGLFLISDFPADFSLTSMDWIFRIRLFPKIFTGLAFFLLAVYYFMEALKPVKTYDWSLVFPELAWLSESTVEGENDFLRPKEL